MSAMRRDVAPQLWVRLHVYIAVNLPSCVYENINPATQCGYIYYLQSDLIVAHTYKTLSRRNGEPPIAGGSIVGSKALSSPSTCVFLHLIDGKNHCELLKRGRNFLALWAADDTIFLPLLGAQIESGLKDAIIVLMDVLLCSQDLDL